MGRSSADAESITRGHHLSVFILAFLFFQFLDNFTSWTDWCVCVPPSVDDDPFSSSSSSSSYRFIDGRNKREPDPFLDTDDRWELRVPKTNSPFFKLDCTTPTLYIPHTHTHTLKCCSSSFQFNVLLSGRHTKKGSRLAAPFVRGRVSCLIRFLLISILLTQQQQQQQHRGQNSTPRYHPVKSHTHKKGETSGGGGEWNAKLLRIEKEEKTWRHFQMELGWI